MLQRYLYLASTVVSLILLPGCLKEDLSKISNDLRWKPSISLPLSSIIFTADNFQVPPSELGINSTPVFSKSIDFDFSEIHANSGYADSLMFRMEIKNSFPAQLNVAAYFMDDQGSIIQNIVLKPPLILNKPLIDSDGNIIQIEKLLYEQTLNKGDISALEQTKSILVIVRIENLELKPEVLDKSDEWKIDISIGLRSAMNIPIDEI